MCAYHTYCVWMHAVYKDKLDLTSCRSLFWLVAADIKAERLGVTSHAPRGGLAFEWAIGPPSAGFGEALSLSLSLKTPVMHISESAYSSTNFGGALWIDLLTRLIIFVAFLSPTCSNRRADPSLPQSPDVSQNVALPERTAGRAGRRRSDWV